MNALEISSLTKIYGTNYALKELTINIEAGRVYGLIGPNGAGKTTAMSIIATLLAPDGGTALVGGHNVVKEPAQVRSLIGYMPDFFGV